MQNVNWSKLVAQGRAKAQGVSWTETEAKLLAGAGNDAKKALYVEALRAGATVEEVLSGSFGTKPEEGVGSGGTSTVAAEDMSKKELEEALTAMGVEFPANATKKKLLEVLKQAGETEQPEVVSGAEEAPAEGEQAEEAE